ncbi:undecaprenyl-diphosphate phosphatase [Synechococcus elongatus IITB4]|uniref:undecaprenyl-diphosphate phosphatase n=1 Tax=Synechococcus elongatus TaxID=32046 RepID=UPI0030D139A1
MLIAVSSADRLDLWQAIVLGFVQGATEFLPISSTAHLKVVPVVLGWGDPGVAFTAVIQLGSIVAVLSYFRQDLTYVLRGLVSAVRQKDFRSEPAQMGLGILFGTIPILIGGLLIKRFIPDYDNSPLRSLGAIAVVSIVMGLLLGASEQLSKHQRDLSQLRLADGLWMGLAQALALVPGVSRSGSTLTAGLFRGLKRDTAARFSFLLGIPAITIAGLVELKDLLEAGLDGSSLGVLTIGTLSSLIFSWLAIAWLLRFLRTHNTWSFVIYRIIFGGLILTAIATGTLQNI